MAMMLGIDTGGTYTDAVLMTSALDVVASAKAPTSHDDLKVGIGAAIDAVLGQQQVAAQDISLVSISTTLATNALVEGRGGSVALVMAGFKPGIEVKGELGQALDGDPCLHIAGGHDASGQARCEIDLTSLGEGLPALTASVEAVAVASVFAVRNPEHEIAIQEAVREKTGLPVTCSHHLSSNLDAPRRAMTTVLNARLISLIHRLINDTREKLSNSGIEAPLMVVRGDGALMSAEQAIQRPIETILSGPAASLVGAAHLTASTDAVVSDIGGTTTDIGVLEGGRPRLAPDGAQVGGFRTMVEAVDMYTIGLGGDSEVHLSPEGIPGLRLGPRRVIPLATLAQRFPGPVLTALEKQVDAGRPLENAGRFALRLRDKPAAGASSAELAVLERLGPVPVAVEELAASRIQLGAIKGLWNQGVIQLSAITPTDAAHVLGLQETGNRAASKLGYGLVAVQKDNRGLAVADTAETLAGHVIEALHRQTLRGLTIAALRHRTGAGPGAAMPSDALLDFLGARSANGPKTGLLQVPVTLSLPLVGLGASAWLYYPPVAEGLNTQALLAEHADVANAVGAVAGQVRFEASARIVEHDAGAFRVFSHEPPQDYASYDKALNETRLALEALATSRAREAGADDVSIECRTSATEASIEGRTYLAEARVVVTASGRPRFAL